MKLSREEDRILEKYYPTEGPRVIARLKGRTASAIQQRVAIFGYKMNSEARSALRRGPGTVAKKPKIEQKPPQPMRRVPRPIGSNGSAGLPAEYGKTASTKEGLQPVPERAIGLPWVSYPKTVEDCRGVIARCRYVLDEFGISMSAGERKYFETSIRYAEATLGNLDAVPA